MGPGGSGPASWRRQHKPAGRAGRVWHLAETPAHTPPLTRHIPARSCGVRASHQRQPRGAGLVGEGELCVAGWSPAHSGRVLQAAQRGVPAPSKPPGLRDSHRHGLSFWLGVLVLDCEVGRAPATRSALATAQVATAMWGQQVVRSSVLSVRVEGLVPLVIREGCMEVVALE